MHSFDPQIAKQVGVNAAVIYQNIIWWCAKNAANRKHEHDGRFWTYNSVKAWNELFPYMTAKQIRSALDRLECDGFILSGNFNTSAYDRTKWYCPSEQIHLPCKANEVATEGKPIPVSKPDIKPDTERAVSAKRPPRACSLPEEWVPSERNIEDANARGFTHQEIENEADQFRDYHLARGSTFKDWNAAWRTWLGNAKRYKGRAMAGGSHTGSGERGASMASIIARRHAGFDI